MGWICVLLPVAGCVGTTNRIDPDDPDPARCLIDSQEFRSMCSTIAQSLIRIDQIQRASSAPTIAFAEMDNKSGVVLDGGAFLARIRKELISNSCGKVVFLDRDRADHVWQERHAKERGLITGISVRSVYGADYLLTGRVDSIISSSGRMRTTYARFSFRLTDASTSAIVWEDDYEVKHIYKRDIYDR